MSETRINKINFTMNFKLLLAILFSVIVLPLCAQEPFDLVFRYQPGTIYKYRSVDTFTSQQEDNGQEIKIDGGNYSLFKMEVIAVAPDSSMTFISSYDEMKIVVKSPMMDTTIYQEDMIGKRMKVVLTKHGKELSKKMLDSIDNSRTKSLMTMTSIQNVSFFQLPGRSVATGEKWMAEINDSSDFGVGYTIQTGAVEYTIAGVEPKNGRTCLKIDFISKSEHVGKMKQMGMDVFIEGTGDTTGTIWFDAIAGILVQRESTAIKDMTFAITGPMTMSIPMVEYIKSTYSLVEK